MYDLSSYSFPLPEELIAQYPVEPRDQARLLVVDRQTQTLTDTTFRDVVRYLHAGDVLVANESKVIPARLYAHRTTGARIEVLLLEREASNTWLALLKPAGKVHSGEVLHFDAGVTGKVVREGDEGKRLISFEGDVDAMMQRFGHMPLPPYIRKGKDRPEDRNDYQTVFASKEGSVAAPTAGLHFTEGLIHTIKEKGVCWCTTTLHVGIGTFLPIREADIRNHKMHHERYWVTQETARLINEKKQGKRVVAVGTTALRTLEASSDDKGQVVAQDGATDLFIYPGYRFKAVDALITNFHLPESSLLLLVAAFMGFDFMHKVYAHAVKEQYRFFSYGDAMLIL